MRFRYPLDDVFRNQSHIRVLRSLIELPDGFGASARELSRRSGVSHPTASRVLLALADIGIVTVDRGPVADAFQLNTDHVLMDALRSVFDGERGLRDELIVFLGEQVGRMPVVEAYLFGSVARGDADRVSDIDIALVCEPDDEDELAAMLDDLSDASRRRYGNAVQPIVQPIGRRRESGLWDRIRHEGIDLLHGEADRSA